MLILNKYHRPVSVQQSQLKSHLVDLADDFANDIGAQKAVIEEEICQKLLELGFCGFPAHIFVQFFKIVFGDTESLTPAESDSQFCTC